MSVVPDELRDGLVGRLGEGAVRDDPDTLASYSYSLAGIHGESPQIVVKPESGDDIQYVVEQANRYGLNLIPSSSGPPGVRGATVPVGEAIIVDLSGMRRIIRLDERNKAALIEPGVTFEDLKVEAAKKGLKVMNPLHPRRDKSVVASYLDREPHLIPKYHWDMTDPLLCVEVVFGAGDLFRTGSAAGPGTLEQQWEAGQAQKNPMGPGQTDMVRLIQGAQGTMGIVTWASVKLEVLPRIRRIFILGTDSLSGLLDFSYRCLRKKVGDEFLILNALNLASLLGEGSERIGSRTRKEKLAEWNLITCVSGYRYYPGRRADLQEESLRRTARECGLDIQRDIPGVSKEELFDVLDNPSPELYWKLRYRGSFRELFFLTTLDRTPRIVSMVNEEIDNARYPDLEAGIYVQPIQHGRACHVEFNFFLDPSDGDRGAQLDGLVGGTAEKLMGEGAFFSRPYGSWAGPAFERCPDTVDALKKVKRTLDPNNVLNRGRLCL